MNDYLLSVVLGIIEGLTEFLPVSSTAHLRIAEALFHISLSDGYWKMYTIVIQLGAILCLPVYFRERIAKLLSTFPQGESGDRTILTHPLGLTAVAFVTTAIPAFLLTKIIGKHLESLHIMGAVPADRRNCDVDRRCHECAGGSCWARRSGKPHPHLEDGSHEPGSGDLDWSLPDSVGGFSRHFAIDVHDRRWSTGGHVAGFGAGVFVFSFDSHHGGGYLL